VHGGRLVANVDDREPRVERRVEHRHHVVAGEREDMARAGRRQRAREDIGAAQPHQGGVSFSIPPM
jgi:hypothetical protein